MRRLMGWFKHLFLLVKQELFTADHLDHLDPLGLREQQVMPFIFFKDTVLKPIINPLEVCNHTISTTIAGSIGPRGYQGNTQTLWY